MTGWNLPPGVSVADIDRDANCCDCLCEDCVFTDGEAVYRGHCDPCEDGECFCMSYHQGPDTLAEKYED